MEQLHDIEQVIIRYDARKAQSQGSYHGISGTSYGTWCSINLYYAPEPISGPSQCATSHKYYNNKHLEILNVAELYQTNKGQRIRLSFTEANKSCE
jgi:hypothetical protein